MAGKLPRIGGATAQPTTTNGRSLVLKLTLAGHGDGSRHPTATCGSSRLSTAMAAKSRYQNRIELLQGTLDMLILRTLQWGPQHGHGIGLAIRANSGELLHVETGSLYPG